MDNAIKAELLKQLRTGNVARVRELILSCPESLKADYGLSSLLHWAAYYDNVDMVAMLVEHGMDVNTPATPKDRVGPLANAASDGAIRVARWLLERGANSDTQVVALGRACDKGNLDMVKLLVEHGADINATWGDPPMNALAYAMLYEHEEVEEYLRSKGAKLEEGTEIREVEASEDERKPIQVEEGRTAIWQHVRDHWGRPIPLKALEAPPGDPPIQIHLVPGEALFRDYSVLVTEGMSSKAMKLPKGVVKDYQYAELVIYLPVTWPLHDAKKLSKAKFAWPIEWLGKIARWPHANKTWLGGICGIIPNGEPPEPLGPDLPFTCTMVYVQSGEGGTLTRPDGAVVKFYYLTPLYTEERNLSNKEGLGTLLRNINKIRKDVIVDLKRPNVALGGKSGKPPSAAKTSRGKKNAKGK